MAYQALYRKYRPITFDDVVGQEIVVKTLKNALLTEKTSHAYMFSGPRGTGKTTIAKILAKSLNCLDLQDGNACNVCENCHTILESGDTDIIEIDAASNNGVDEIREIRNKINLVPSVLKYKVYIIDEVHMLSVGAFNALLKTLEEPPSHVVFILATTDPHKVPITIISRCQCFEFKRISDESIIQRLQDICKKENITIDLEVLQKIAKISEGGMRDSLGLLDKISSYCTGNITIDEFNKVMGVVDDSLRFSFIGAVYHKDLIKIIEFIDQIYSSGKDFVIFTQDLMDELRNYMVQYYVKSEELYPISFILEFISKLDGMLTNLKNSNNLKIIFETSILTFANEYSSQFSCSNSVDNSQIISREIIESQKNVITEQKKQEVDTIGPKIEDSTLSNQNESVENDELLEFREKQNSVRFAIVNNTFATAKKEYLNNLKQKWTQFNDFALDKSYGAAACYLIDSELRAVGENEFIITCNYESVLERGLGLLLPMQELVEKVVQKKYQIAILTTQEWEQERKKFIDLKAQGKSFEYKKIDEMIQCDKKNSVGTYAQSELVKQAISIFGEDIVKVRED